MIKYYCDFCKKNISKQELYVVTLQVPSREVKRNKHLCSECGKKLDKFLDTESNSIESSDEEPKVTITLDSYTKVQQAKTILEKKPDWTMSHEICESFMKDEKAYLEYLQNKCSGIDVGMIFALYKAGWKAKDITEDIGYNREDAVSEIIFYYELTGNIPKLEPVRQICSEEKPKVVPKKSIENEPRNIPIEYIDEFIKTMIERYDVTNEMRKAILTSYCTTTKSANSVAKECDVSLNCVLSLTKGYMNYLKSLESKDDSTIESEELEKSPVVSVDDSKVAEFVGTLRKNVKVPNTLRVELIKSACSGMSLGDVSRKYKVQYNLVNSLFNRYLEYLKEMY